MVTVKLNLRNVIAIAICLAATTMFSGCDKEKDLNGMGKPAVVINFTATAGDAKVSLTWDAPLENGGSEITGYEVTMDNWKNKVTKLANELSHTYTGLTNGTAYTFVVRAVNANGVGAESAKVATPNNGTPAAVMNFTATAGSAKVSLAWDAPLKNGGSEITGYEITMDNWANKVTKTANELSHIYTGLTNGTTYTFKIRAVNANGVGEESAKTATPEGEITLPNSQESTQTAFADEKTSGNFSFTAKGSWTATIVESAGNSGWVTLFRNGVETNSGGAGTFTMAISLVPNYSGQPRSATIDIVSGNDKITITVTQSGTTAGGKVPVSEITVYEKIMAMKDQYPEGMSWTNDNFYQWKGGIYSGGAGCAGFAFLLSDAAFGNLPARKHFDFDNLRIGDILRMNNDTHSVVIIGIDENNVTLAEGNYNSSIHWGRKLSIQQVKTTSTYVLTRYPL